MSGQDLINLTIFRLIRPKAYIDEVRAYVHNRNPANPPYSRSQIHRAETRLGIWLKVGSTTSDMAYTPINLEKRRQYWRRMVGVKAENVIDIDEAMFKLQAQNRSRGKVTCQRRCDARGRY